MASSIADSPRASASPRRIVATAHKIARAVYAMLKYRRPFELVASQEYERRLREQEIVRLRKKAARLGLQLVPLAT